MVLDILKNSTKKETGICALHCRSLFLFLYIIFLHPQSSVPLPGSGRLP